MRLFGLRTRNTRFLEGGIGIIAGDVTAERLPVKLLSPLSQLGRTWLLKPSNLRAADPSSLGLPASAKAVASAVTRALHDRKPMDRSRWWRLLPRALLDAGLSERDLAELYAGRDRQNRGCGGPEQSCKLADELIAEAAERGWRPGRPRAVHAGSSSSMRLAAREVANASMPSPRDYRLGDLYRWPGQFGPPSLPLYRWQPSVGADYHATTARGSNLAALRTAMEAARPLCEAAAASASASRETCAVHLRLGDVLEQPPSLDLDALWANGSAGITRLYAFPRCYYRAAIGWLRASRPSVKRVVLVGNLRASEMHLGRGGHRVVVGTRGRSEAYLRRVRHLFASSGYVTVLHTHAGASADCDLLLLASAGCLVPGGGGFGMLAAELARDAGPVFAGSSQCALATQA